MEAEQKVNKDITEEELLKKIKELEKKVYLKDMEIEFKEIVVELCSDKLGYDIKEKYANMLKLDTKE